MLSPVLGLVKVADHAMADRYMYLPGIGLSIAWPGGPCGWPPARPRGRWVLGHVRRADRSLVLTALADLADVVLARRRDACGGTPWHAPPTTARPNWAWPTRWLGRAGATRRSPIIAGPSSTRPIPGPITIWGRYSAGRANWTRRSPSFARRWQSNPIRFPAHVNLGVALGHQNRFDESLEHFRRALEINPRGVSTHRGLAHLLLLEGKPTRLPSSSGRSRSIRDTAARNDLATTLLRQNKFDQAIPQLEAALAVDPRLLPARLNLAAALESARPNRRGDGPISPHPLSESRLFRGAEDVAAPATAPACGPRPFAGGMFALLISPRARSAVANHCRQTSAVGRARRTG